MNNNKNELEKVKQKIELLRAQLNNSIASKSDPKEILKISQDLDKLLNIYYELKNKNV